MKADGVHIDCCTITGYRSGTSLLACSISRVIYERVVCLAGLVNRVCGRLTLATLKIHLHCYLLMLYVFDLKV